jgi:quercetin dioxygenase-like cupin family protein
MAKLKSTLKVYNADDLKGKEGHGKGHVQKVLVGNDERPSERLRASLNTFEPGTYIPLHWHPIEGIYCCIAGRAILKDVEGKSYEIVPPKFIYISPGIACAHEWEVKEKLQLIAVRATTAPEKNIQFTVDKSNMRSFIEFDYLVEQAGASFKSFY